MRFLRRLLVVVLLLAIVAGALAWTAPADLAYRLFGARLAPLEAQGLGGSVWDGSAERVSAMGLVLGKARWHVDRMAALRGRLQGDIDVQGQDVNGHARFARGPGALDVQGLEAKFPAQLLAPALDIPALVLLGTVALDVERLEFADGVLRTAQGRATWADLGVSGGAEARLPGLEIVFAPDASGSIVADIHDLGGPLAIAGRTTITGLAYRSETHLYLREPNPQLEEALKWIGERSPSPEGGSLLRIEGQIQPLR
ncbi:MAG TPA: type II secretion system protein N [Xanthomonadales bacterium]|nr:type II secretion system protein N [Xanthomonadales bacterium]